MQSVFLPEDNSNLFAFFPLLLLLSGDIELNPGPRTGKIQQVCDDIILNSAGNTPRSVLQFHYANLTDAISKNLYKVTDALYTKSLIPKETLDHIQATQGVSDLIKSSQLVSELQQQVLVSPNPDQYLISLCRVLAKKQCHAIATSILHRLGSVDVNLCLESSSSILRSHYNSLPDAITDSLHGVTNALYAKGLITKEAKSFIETATGISDLQKSNQLVTKLEALLSTSDDPDQCLIDICHVLIDQNHKTLADITASILHQLGKHLYILLYICYVYDPVGQPIPDKVELINSLPNSVQEYADIMKKRYIKQPIVAEDWPPRVGHNFFGRLGLVTKEKSTTQPQDCRSANWYMLRGHVDRIPDLPGYEEITVEDVLKSNSSGIYVIIDGPPGIGKTTLCRKLLNMWSNGTLPHQQYFLVLYCPLRNTRVASAATLAELFIYENPKVPKVVDWMSEKEGEGMLIIFDGWDELSVKHRRSSLAARIARRELLTECSLIFTSRSYASSSLLRFSHFNKHVQVIGFSREEIFTVVIKIIQKDPEESQKVIDTVFKDQTGVALNSDSKSALKLINDLKVHGDVLSLCYVPLICSMVIVVYCKLGRLPTTLTQLYENFILQTIRRHVEIKERHDEINPYAIEKLPLLPQQLVKPFEELCQLAYTNLTNTRMTFTSSQLQQSSINEDFLGLITTFIDYDEMTHQFLHLTIQEFLAAWWIFKHEETEKKFNDHFDDDHFRMCLRFTAGLTHLEHESYQQYFNQWQLDLQCKARLPTVFEAYCCPLFSESDSLMTEKCGTYCIEDFELIHNSSKLLHIQLFQLLYESQNATLCGVLAQSVINASICLDAQTLSLFETLCFGYFINNSNTTWNQLHLVLPNEQCIAAFTRDHQPTIQCKALKLSLKDCSNESIHKLAQRPLLCNVQELQCSLSGLSEISNSFTHDFVLLEVLKLPHLKILYFNEERTYRGTENCSEIEKCLETKLTLKELYVKLPNGNKSIVNSIIRGVTRNEIMTSFSLVTQYIDIMVDIRALLKHNKTLKSFTLIVDAGLKPMLIKEIKFTEVRTPLTSLKLLLCAGGEKQIESMLRHIKGLKCLILQPVAYTPLRVDSHPGLQQLALQLDTEEIAITLFTHLMTNTTLRALKVWIYEPLLSIRKVGTRLKAMLKKNATLQCFEIEARILYFFSTLPIEFMSLMADGLRSNTNIQQLRIPIVISPDENVIQTFLLNIFHMKHLKELQLNIHSLPDTGPKMVFSTMVSFSELVLPALTEMLQLKKPIRSLCIQYNIFTSDERKKTVEQFHEAIFLHPTLEYVEVISSSLELEPIFKAQKEALIAKHKEKQPIPKVVHILKHFFDEKMNPTHSPFQS